MRPLLGLLAFVAAFFAGIGAWAITGPGAVTDTETGGPVVSFGRLEVLSVSATLPSPMEKNGGPLLLGLPESVFEGDEDEALIESGSFAAGRVSETSVICDCGFQKDLKQGHPDFDLSSQRRSRSNPSHAPPLLKHRFGDGVVDGAGCHPRVVGKKTGRRWKAEVFNSPETREGGVTRVSCGYSWVMGTGSAGVYCAGRLDRLNDRADAGANGAAWYSIFLLVEGTTAGLLIMQLSPA